MGYVKGESPGQSNLFPPSLDELVPEDHAVRVIEAYVQSLNLRELGFERAVPEATGRPGYDPADLLKLYLYGYMNRIRTSRVLERECQRNVELMWLLGKLAPDFKTIADFRRVNGKAFVRVCAAFVRFCCEARLIGGEQVAIDGSKFQAVAARRRVITPKSLAEESKRLEGRIAQYLAKLEQADREESEEPLDRAAVRAALKKLRDQQVGCESAQALLKEVGETQYVVGEPDAKLMSCGHTQKVAYNVQAAIDAKHGLVVHHEVSNNGSDGGQLEAMAKATQESLGGGPLQVLADMGYSNGTQFAACEQAGIEPFVPFRRRFNGRTESEFYTPEQFKYDPVSDAYRCPADKVLVFKKLIPDQHLRRYIASARDCTRCALKSQCTDAKKRTLNRHVHEEAFERMEKRLQNAPDTAKLRRCLAEHPFADLKCWVLGNGRLLLRGLRGARTEMALAVLVRNMRRVMNILGVQNLIRQLAAA
jgi:transposase